MERQQSLLTDKLLIYAIVAIIVIRVLSVFVMGPMPQDAYYYLYSQHPSLSYFDHPPAIAFLLKIFTWLLGSNVIAVKLANTVLTIGTVFLFYELALAFFSKAQAFRATLILLSTLMISILSLVSTPDTPLVFFWTLAVICLQKAVLLNRKVFWIWAGIAMGLAFDSKYTAIFLPFGMLIFLILSNSHRKFLTTAWPWLSCLVMVCVSAPVIIWNAQHHFASFAFQGAQRMGQMSAFAVKPNFIFGLLGHQLALLMPILFITLFYGLYILLRRYWKKFRELPVNDLFLLSFFLPVFLLFLLIAPVYWIKINWMIPNYISGILWVSTYMNARWFKWQILISLLIHIALIIEILFYPFPVRSDDTWIGWKELSQKVSIIKKQQNADFIFSADSYKTAAELNFYSSNFIFGQNVLGEPALEFDFLGTDLRKLNGKNAIYIDSAPYFKDLGMDTIPPEKLKPYFKSIEQLPPVIIRINNKPVRKFLIYLCKDYHYTRQKAVLNKAH